jgi:hypothetical protein
MIDVFDVIAFVMFGVLLAVAVIIVVSLGQLLGRIAQKRGGTRMRRPSILPIGLAWRPSR